MGFSFTMGKDLRRMQSNASVLWTEMSKEHVNCRRAGRNTPKFNDLTAQLTQALDTIDQYLVIATLLENG